MRNQALAMWIIQFDLHSSQQDQDVLVAFLKIS
jgi:hypothetical protein